MNITGMDKVEKIKVDMEGAKEVQRQLMIGSAHGSPSFSFRVFTIQPGGHTPHHSHPFEHLNYIIEGNAVVLDNDGRENPVKKGDFVLMPPNEKHQYRNASPTDPFVMICAVPKEYE